MSSKIPWLDTLQSSEFRRKQDWKVILTSFLYCFTVIQNSIFSFKKWSWLKYWKENQFQFFFAKIDYFKLQNASNTSNIKFFRRELVKIIFFSMFWFWNFPSNSSFLKGKLKLFIHFYVKNAKKLIFEFSLKLNFWTKNLLLTHCVR